MKKKDYSFKIECHSPKSLWGIFRVRNARGVKVAKGYEEDPRQQPSGTSTLLNNTPLPRCAVLSPQGGQRTARSFFTRPSSPRSVGMRGIGVARGFTLIELLVVILIIGILAAIALPQYQKAVWRSRNTQLKAVLNSLIKAQELYYLTNGTYANNFANLDIGLPLAKNNDDPCRLTHIGGDAIRSTENYYAVLNNASTNSFYVLSVVWKKGPYKCAGFGYGLAGTSKPRQFECIEARHSGYNLKGAFCETLEKGFSPYDWAFWERYALP